MWKTDSLTLEQELLYLSLASTHSSNDLLMRLGDLFLDKTGHNPVT